MLKSRVEALAATYGRLTLVGNLKHTLQNPRKQQLTSAKAFQPCFPASTDTLNILVTSIPNRLQAPCTVLKCHVITVDETYIYEQCEAAKQALLRHRRECVVLAKRNQLKRKLHQSSPPLRTVAIDNTTAPSTTVATANVPVLSPSRTQRSIASQTHLFSVTEAATQTEQIWAYCISAGDDSSTSTTVEVPEEMSFIYYYWDIDYRHYCDVFDSPLFLMFNRMWRLSIYRTNHHYSVSLHHFQSLSKQGEPLALHCTIQLHLLLLPPYTIYTRDPLLFTGCESQINIIDDVISVAHLQHYVSTTGCLTMCVGLREVQEYSDTTQDSDDITAV